MNRRNPDEIGNWIMGLSPAKDRLYGAILMLLLGWFVIPGLAFGLIAKGVLTWRWREAWNETFG